VHALLLSAVNVECDLNAERILIDRWGARAQGRRTQGLGLEVHSVGCKV
jgi:hypothetical protein